MLARMETADSINPLKTVETAPCACVEPVVMSVPEAALMLGRSKEYLYAGLREGRFPCVTTGRGRSLPRAFMCAFVAEVVEAGLSISFEDFAAAWMAQATTRQAQAVAS